MTQEEIKNAAAEYASSLFIPGSYPFENCKAAYREGAIMANNAAEDRIKELETALALLLDWAVIRPDWAKEGKPEPEDHPITIAKRSLQK